MSEITFTINQDDYVDNRSTPVVLFRDSTGINKLTETPMSSPDFDGIIPIITGSIGISQLKAGNYIGVEEGGNTNYYTVLTISAPDPIMDSPYTGEYSIFYLKGNSIVTQVVTSSTASVVAKYEDWANKSVGNVGWTITPQGNAIFANIAARGRIEATSGYIGNTTSGWKIESNLLSNASVGFYAPSVITGQVAIFAGAPFDDRANAPFRVKYDGSMVASNASISGNLTATTLDVGGANGITYNGSQVTIGSSVTINAPVTVNSLQVGASPTLLRIADNVNGTNDGIYINANNYWYSDGQFGVGGSANNVVWSGSSLTVTGTINATTITASNGTIAGFNLSKDNLTLGDITFSSSGGLRLGNPVKFSVDQNGNLVATSASITGNITANSGAFTGSISAQHITASTGSIAGFALANNQLYTASVIVSSSGGLRLGNPTVFSVNQYGNLVAQNASITGNINATSGSFSGDITAAAGRFTGSVVIDTNGLLYVGSLSGQRVVVANNGLYGFHQNGLEAFALPVGSNPRIGTFTIVPTGIVSQSASNANFIIGDVSPDGNASAGIVLRGYRSPSASIAIYSIQNGVATDFSSGNGFYVDENARFKLKGATGSLSFDGSDLYISGNINARSGQFTGSVSAQHVTASNGVFAGWTIASQNISRTFGSKKMAFGLTEKESIAYGITFDTSTYTNTWFTRNSGTASNSTFFRSGDGDLNSGSTYIQLDTYYSNNNRIRFANGVFEVDPSGKLTATSASIIGSLTSSVGNIGGWTLSASTFTGNSASLDAAGSIKLGSGQNIVALSSTDTNRIWAGSAVSTNAPFRVSNSGGLFATTASITGDITAQSGSFTGNVVISSGTIYAGSVTGTGQRVLLNSSGLQGYTATDTNAFYLSTGVGSRLTDGGFESQGAAGTLIGGAWTPFWGDAASVVVNTTNVKGGTKSMLVWDNASMLQSVNQTFTQTVGQTYSVTAWVRSSSALNISNGHVEIWLLSSSVSTTPGYFDSNSILQTVTPATSLLQDTWTKLSGTYIATAPSATLALRTYSLSSSVLVYWDSVEVSVGSNVSNIGGFFFDDEALYTNYVNISSQGNATFGTFDASSTSSVASAVATTSNFLTLSGTNPTYRLWVGSSDPAKSYLSIEKTGNININSGGDIILSSSAAGASDFQLSKVSFRTDGSTTNHARIQWTPSASSFAVGTAGGSSLLRSLNLTSPSVNITGTNSVNVSGQLNTQSTLMERSVSAISNPVLVLNSTNNYTSSWRAISFRKNGTDLGYITVSASVGSPRFESASDYRLKTNIEEVDLFNASEKIKSLRPVMFNWTSDPSSPVKIIGFLAHEVAEVIPDAVGGAEKDAVDEYGNIIPQTIMNTTFIEYIIASLKNALIRIDDLESMVESQRLDIEELSVRLSAST